MKEFWDFNENVNFSMVRGYKVLNIYTNLADAAKLLNLLEFTIHKSLMNIRRTEKITPEINLLLTTPFKLQEMQLEELQGSVIFEGLNKPKEIYTDKGSRSIGKDGNLRATYRDIFLTIRNKSGKIRKIKNILPLLSHELAHTALNHVRWRDDDHGRTFNVLDKMILKHLRLNV